MTTDTARATPYPGYVAGRAQPATLAGLLVILTEGIFFALLFTSYFYILSGSNQWPQGGIKPEDLKIPSIETVILLSSSLPMIWAERAIGRGHIMQMRIGYKLTLFMGTAFLALLGFEYANLDLKASDNAYASLFLLIVSFHGTHVFVGLLMNIFVQVRSWLGHFDEHRHLAVQNVSWYWHFVDTVWIFIFLIVYLTPHWYGPHA
jgi:heme/copper-type cytochrome/quinol oxidase subunit 3